MGVIPPFVSPLPAFRITPLYEFYSDFESGVLVGDNYNDCFEVVTTDGGYVECKAGSALNSTDYGVEITVTGANQIYCRHDVIFTDTDKFRFRFYLDITNLTMADGDEFILAGVYWTYDQCINIYLDRSGSNYRLEVRYYKDSSYVNSSDYTITKTGEHYLEIYIGRASSAVASDGFIYFWIDGAQKWSSTAVDNYDTWLDMDNFWIGIRNRDSGTSGTYDVDEVVGNKSGNVIGA